MTREELEFAAHQAICRWADTAKPTLPGKPKFQVTSCERLVNFHVSCELLTHTKRAGYIYLLDAQEVLDSFDAIDRMSLDKAKLETAWMQPSARQIKQIKEKPMTTNQFKALREAIEALKHLKHINNDGGVVVMDECEMNDLNGSLTELEEKFKAEGRN